MVMIVKRDGRIEEYSKDKLIKILNTKHNTVETLAIIDFVEKELAKRFEEFYPNTDNIKDIVEKYSLLKKNDRL
jgi:transcriptional regulator NrdR family protein